MARTESQKNLNGDIPEPLHAAVMDWVSEHRDTKIRQVVRAMAELWLALPEPLQAIILICKTDSPAWKKAAYASVPEVLAQHKELTSATADAATVVHHALALAASYALAGPWIKTEEDLFETLDLLGHLFVLREISVPEETREEDKIAIEAICRALKTRMGLSNEGKRTMGLKPGDAEAFVQHAAQANPANQKETSSGS